MVSNLVTVAPDSSIDKVVDLFKQDKVAIIADDKSFYGLITQIDLINHLRQTMV
jgi:cystathionine beta-synthase